MSPIRKNILANYGGAFWNALMSLMFIPLYIKFMGIEAYGLVGVFASLQALFGIMDMGLSATMTREMARLTPLDPTGRERRELARTLEIIYWAVAVVLGVAVALLAGPIADHWVKPDRLERETVKQALFIMGVVIALRWPVSFYAGGLRGLDRQPLLNLIMSGCATLRGVGAVLVLWLIAPTVDVFFLFQGVVSAVETLSLALALWFSFPGAATEVSFSTNKLKGVWRFSAGMTGIGAVVLLLTQTDKIILSKMLPLDQFGYYTLAWTVSAMLLRLIEPIDSAVYPTLTRLAAENNEKELCAVYHKSCQMQVVLLVPAALTLILFGDAALTLWSGSPDLVRNTGPILGILAIGTCLNGFMHIPYHTQLAHGWTSLCFYQNVVSVILLVPLTILLCSAYRGVGAAWVWVILNTGYVLISIHIMHRRILKGVKWNWYVHDIGLPTMAALVVALSCRLAMPANLPTMLQTLYVGTAIGLAFCAALLAAPLPRARLLDALAILAQKAVIRTN